MINIIKIDEISEYANQIDSWSCGLWWGDFEEAAIQDCYVVLDNDNPVGFQTINTDGFCTAIEIHPEYQGRGLASALIEESGCWCPDRNENPEFWAAIASKYCEEDE